MPFLQDLIHKTEVAGGVRYVRYTLAFLAAALVLVAYNLRVAKNFGTQEAMDAAQLGRNIAEGKGYTTSFVRPFSMHLISQHNQENASGKAQLPRGSSGGSNGRYQCRAIAGGARRTALVAGRRRRRRQPPAPAGPRGRARRGARQCL